MPKEWAERARKGREGKMWAWNKGLKEGHKGVTAGKKHYAWKGDKVGIKALHQWVKRKRGHTKNCEFCGAYVENPYKIHWANKSGEYKRDVEDWLRLCVPCHKNYDLKRLGII